MLYVCVSVGVCLQILIFDVSLYGHLHVTSGLLFALYSNMQVTQKGRNDKRCLQDSSS